MINWKVRAKNRLFWISFIPAALLLAQAAAAVFGIELETGVLNGRLIDFVNALFALLGLVGVVTDPTTEGLSDSLRAMTYDEPN